MVSPALAQQFAQWGYPLPDGVGSTAVSPGSHWTIAQPGQSPLYQLASSAAAIDVHTYPSALVSQRNFYMQPTSSDPHRYEYQLREVVLRDGVPFDMDQTSSWGRMTLPHINDAVVHPQGYVIAAHYAIDRLEVLRLPTEPSSDAEAVPAVVIAGPGTRPGLLRGPRALSVTADGRVLVLEDGNARIQALDVHGNPVPSFAGARLTTLATDEAANLDAGLASQSLRTAFAAAGVALSKIWLIRHAKRFYRLSDDGTQMLVTSDGRNLSTTWTIADGAGVVLTANLDGESIVVSGAGLQEITLDATKNMLTLDGAMLPEALVTALAAQQLTLVAPVTIAGDQFTLDQSIETQLCQGLVPPSLVSGLAARNLEIEADDPVAASVRIKQMSPGRAWQLCDRASGLTWAISADQQPGVLTVTALEAVAALTTPPTSDVSYLSLTTEDQGYIYVSGYTGDGSEPGAFFLDIYRPDGSFLNRTAGVNAGRICVDMWRNLYSLDFDAFMGPGGRTEPTVSMWTPSV